MIEEIIGMNEIKTSPNCYNCVKYPECPSERGMDEDDIRALTYCDEYEVTE